MKNKAIIRKMIAYIEKIFRYCGEVTQENFVSDSLLVEACVFNLSQIGELAIKLDAEFVESHSELPWRQMRGLRNRIVHDYEGVNLILVWEIIHNDLPELLERLKMLA